MSDRVIVVGGSAAGLSTALLLARNGHQVDVIDRDDLAPAADVEAAAKAAARPAAPQLVHTHQHQPLARQILRDRLPDVYRELLEAGATESPLSDRMPSTLPDRSPRPGDEELTVLQVRRSTFDWVLRAAAAEQPGVRLLGRQRAVGLITTGEMPRVCGIETEAGPLRADVVVDASGRRSPLGRWLTAAGARPPQVTVAACGIGYYTRHYRLCPGARAPAPGRLSMIALLPYFTVAAVTADNDTLTVTLSPPLEDRAQRALRDPVAHEAAARTVPSLRPWIAAAEPTSEVFVMGGLHNALRHLVVDGRPVALGLHAVGDSVCTTNPTLGRGLSLALLGATDLVTQLAAYPEDPVAQVHAMDHTVTRHIEPWYAEQAAVDSARLDAVRKTLRGIQAGELPDPADGVTMGHLRAAAMVDPAVFRALMSVISMMRHPSDVYADPGILARVHSAIGTGTAPMAPGPTRAELLNALASGSRSSGEAAGSMN